MCVDWIRALWVLYVLYRVLDLDKDRVSKRAFSGLIGIRLLKGSTGLSLLSQRGFLLCGVEKGFNVKRALAGSGEA